MKLTIKFLKAFLLPLILGICLALSFAISMLFLYSYNSADANIKSKLLEEGLASANIDALSINTLMQKIIYKANIILDMQINQYLELSQISDDLVDLNNHRSCLSLARNYDITDEEVNTTACWYIDNITETIEPPDERTKIIKALSHALQTSIAILNIEKTFISSFYYSFDNYNLFIFYPVDFLFRENMLSMFEKYDNPLLCVNSNGDHPSYYFYKCRDWYIQIKETISMDPDRTIFIMSPYYDVNKDLLKITICKRFKEPISNISGTLCGDIDSKTIFETFDQQNFHLNGHFFIALVNITFPFYFPKMHYPNAYFPISEYEFTLSCHYYLEELITFKTTTTYMLIKDYLKLIDTASNDPLEMMRPIPDPKYNHYFMKNGKVLNYTIYPIVIKLESRYTHLASIVYIYREKYFLSKLFEIQTDIQLKVVTVLVIWIFLSFIVILVIYIYIIVISKFIVIPIKNVGLMLKGINIGGENRLSFIESLLDKSTELVSLTPPRCQSSSLLQQDTNNDDNVKRKNSSENSNLLPSVGADEASRLNNEGNDTKKDSLESSMRDVISFEFNEELLEYRPKEINSLVKVLLDLKKVLLLTSKSEENNNKEMIIEFSKSEHIFEDVKIQEGERICQSNIGNLSASNQNYGLAIYHLALSLQDTHLIKYLSRAITDEFDSKGTLLKLLELTFNKNATNKENISTQQTKLNFATNSIPKLQQKEINKLINNRYNKLIYIYYSFFSVLSKSNDKAQKLEGLYLHTEYHSVHYFQKILLQYVHLCHASNDLIKIGEAILEYIHFLIKFKLHNEDSYVFNKSNKDVYCDLFDCVTYGDIHKIKAAVFDKIVQWVDLFDQYTKYVRDNTMLDSDETIIEQYSKNDKSKAGFRFKVIVQKGYYLKGKLAFICKHYLDAIELFIEASRSDVLVSDGLIRVKALSHLNQITIKLINKENKYQYLLYKKKTNAKEPNWTHKDNQLILQNFKASIDESFEVLNAMREKDVLILIDSHTLQDDSDQRNIKEQIEIIISSHLSMSDRIALFNVDFIEKIICPMTSKDQLNIHELYANLKETNLRNENIIDEEEVCNRNQKALKYCLSYLSAKGINKNQMFCIYFTNGFSADHLLNENEFFNDLDQSPNISLFIVGRIDKAATLIINQQLHLYCNRNSQCVEIDDIKRIKALLLFKQYITNDFEFPNEIYESHMT